MMSLLACAASAISSFGMRRRPELRLGVDREVDEADLLLAVEGDRLVHRRALRRAEVLVGGAVVLLAVAVERVAARHLEVGVRVDGDQVGRCSWRLLSGGVKAASGRPL
jgi:hypothetical protein